MNVACYIVVCVFTSKSKTYSKSSGKHFKTSLLGKSISNKCSLVRKSKLAANANFPYTTECSP